MTSLVDTLPIRRASTAISLQQLLPKNGVTIDNNDTSIVQLLFQHGQSRLIHGNGKRAVRIRMTLGKNNFYFSFCLF